MNSARLPKQQELQVLSKLSSDDDYRARFEQDPVAALKEAGVDDATLKQFDPATLQPGKLADKASIAATHAKLKDANTTDQSCLIIPMLRTNYGKDD
jgi:putative modified peptide